MKIYTIKDALNIIWRLPDNEVEKVREFCRIELIERKEARKENDNTDTE